MAGKKTGMAKVYRKFRGADDEEVLDKLFGSSGGGLLPGETMKKSDLINQNSLLKYLDLFEDESHYCIVVDYVGLQKTSKQVYVTARYEPSKYEHMGGMLGGHGPLHGVALHEHDKASQATMYGAFMYGLFDNPYAGERCITDLMDVNLSYVLSAEGTAAGTALLPTDKVCFLSGGHLLHILSDVFPRVLVYPFFANTSSTQERTFWREHLLHNIFCPSLHGDK